MVSGVEWSEFTGFEHVRLAFDRISDGRGRDGEVLGGYDMRRFKFDQIAVQVALLSLASAFGMRLQSFSYHVSLLCFRTLRHVRLATWIVYGDWRSNLLLFSADAAAEVPGPHTPTFRLCMPVITAYYWLA